MAAAIVILYGRDNCHRAELLRCEGYEVYQLDSLDQLRLHLAANRDVDAVIVSETEPRSAALAAVLVRRYCGAPLILFYPPDAEWEESLYDRVYPSVAPPANWLFDTAVVAMQSKELRAQAEALRRDAETAPEESRWQASRASAPRRKISVAWPPADEPNTAG